MKPDFENDSFYTMDPPDDDVMTEQKYSLSIRNKVQMIMLRLAKYS